MINFIVHEPHPYTDRWGGVVVLHALSDVLAGLGENSYIYAESTFEKNRAQLIHPSTNLSYDPDNTIVIYPEAIANDGNPLNSKYVVRWLLYRTGIWTPGIFPETDLIYTLVDGYVQGLKTSYESTRRGNLFVLNSKFDTFYNKNLERSGECYIVKKGKDKVLDKHSLNSVNIDEYINDEYLAELFNTKEYFICYDPYCYHAQQAALCGCIPIVIPDEGVSKEEFIKNTPVNKYGIAYGMDDIEYAKSTIHLVKPHLQEIENEGIKSVKKFVDDCYKHLNITKEN